MRYVLTLLLALPAAAGDEELVDQLVSQLQSDDVDQVLEALTAAAAVHDKRLMTPLTRLLKDRSSAVRERAIETLSLRKDPADKKKAASAIAARLKSLREKEETGKTELMKSIQALHDLAQKHTIKALLDDTGKRMPSDELKARLMAVANVPTKDAVDRLVQFASSGRRGANRRGGNAHAAIRYATQMEVPRGDIDVVRKWWSDNRKDFDPIAAADKRARWRAEQAEREQKRKERRGRRKKKGDE